MFLHILEARYFQNYKVWLRFSDGLAGAVDLARELEGPVFGPLRDVERFNRFSLTHHTLTWDTGADSAGDGKRRSPGKAPEISHPHPTTALP